MNRKIIRVDFLPLDCRLYRLHNKSDLWISRLSATVNRIYFPSVRTESGKVHRVDTVLVYFSTGRLFLLFRNLFLKNAYGFTKKKLFCAQLVNQNFTKVHAYYVDNYSR